jgi:hypothetical protein
VTATKIEGSKVLTIIRTSGEFTITQSPPGADFSVWRGLSIIAQGGLPLMETVYNKEINRADQSSRSCS